MLKYEFLGILQRELYNLPKNEIKEQLNFYSEIIDDGIEEGLSEEEAITELEHINNEKRSITDAFGFSEE